MQTGPALPQRQQRPRPEFGHGAAESIEEEFAVAAAAVEGAALDTADSTEHHPEDLFRLPPEQPALYLQEGTRT